MHVPRVFIHPRRVAGACRRNDFLQPREHVWVAHATICGSKHGTSITEKSSLLLCRDNMYYDYWKKTD